MSAYSTVEVTPEFAKSFLAGKLATATNKQLGDMMDAFGDEEPYYLNNFTVVDPESAVRRKFVRVTDPAHPHHGEYGSLIPEETVMNGLMTMVKLDNCQHGNEGCYVMKKQYTVVGDE